MSSLCKEPAQTPGYHRKYHQRFSVWEVCAQFAVRSDVLPSLSVPVVFFVCSYRPCVRFCPEARVGGAWRHVLPKGVDAVGIQYWLIDISTCSSLYLSGRYYIFTPFRFSLHLPFHLFIYFIQRVLLIFLLPYKASVFPSGFLERPHLLWYSNLKWYFLLVSRQRRRNLVLPVSERDLGLSSLPALLLSYSFQVNYNSIISTFQLKITLTGCCM